MANENIITSENLEQIPPVPLADNAVDTSVYDTSAVLADLTASQEKARTDVEALQQKGKEETGSIADLQSLMGGREAETVKTYADTGVTKLYEQLTDIGVQAEGLKREQLAIPHMLQEQIAGTGTTERGLAPQTAGALRRNALKALTLGQQAAIAGAQYDKAKNYADQIISAKYAQYEADIVAKKTNLEALREFDLSPAEEKLRVATLSRISKEESILEEQKLIEQREYDEEITEKKGRKDDIQLYSKYAMKAGQSDIASQINSLDPDSNTFSQDLAKLQSQIKDPMVALNIAIKEQQLLKEQNENSLFVKYGGLTPSEFHKRKEEEEERRESTEGTDAAREETFLLSDSLSHIDAVLNSPALRHVVGPSVFSRGAARQKGFWGGALMTTFGALSLGTGAGIKQELTGDSDDMVALTQQLLSQQFLDKLIAVKSKGATFGALSDNEGRALRNAANAVAGTAIKTGSEKEGNLQIIGYDMSEKEFKRQIGIIKSLTIRAYQKAKGEMFTLDEKDFFYSLEENSEDEDFNPAY